MDWFIILVIVIVLFALMVAKLKSRDHNAESYPYKKKPTLFSPAERSFLGVLDQAVGEDYRIFGKVRVADVVSVNPMSDRRAWGSAFSKISAKHIDFVLCSKSDLAVVAAIELDDKSHQQRKRKKRDAFLVGLFQTIELPLIQVPAQRAYSVTELRSQVLSVLSACQESALEPPPEAGAVPKVPTIERVDPELTPVQSIEASQPSAKSEAPRCPKCLAPMVRRKTKAGANAGKEFWGCSTFPKCRAIVPASV